MLAIVLYFIFTLVAFVLVQGALASVLHFAFFAALGVAAAMRAVLPQHEAIVWMSIYGLLFDVFDDGLFGVHVVAVLCVFGLFHFLTKNIPPTAPGRVLHHTLIAIPLALVVGLLYGIAQGVLAVQTISILGVVGYVIVVAVAFLVSVFVLNVCTGIVQLYQRSRDLQKHT